MRTETLNKLCCPFDKKEVKLTIISKDTEENVLEGFLNCTHCKRIFPIIKGIPVMSPDEYRELKLEQPLLDSYNAYLKGKSIENFRLVEANQQ